MPGGRYEIVPVLAEQVQGAGDTWPLWTCNNWRNTCTETKYKRFIFSHLLAKYMMRCLSLQNKNRLYIIRGMYYIYIYVYYRYLMAVSRKGHRPALHRGHCSTWVKYFFSVLGASQGGLVMSRLYMTCCKFLRKMDVAFPCEIMIRTKIQEENRKK